MTKTRRADHRGSDPRAGSRKDRRPACDCLTNRRGTKSLSDVGNTSRSRRERPEDRAPMPRPFGGDGIASCDGVPCPLLRPRPELSVKSLLTTAAEGQSPVRARPSTRASPRQRWAAVPRPEVAAQNMRASSRRSVAFKPDQARIANDLPSPAGPAHCKSPTRKLHLAQSPDGLFSGIAPATTRSLTMGESLAARPALKRDLSEPPPPMRRRRDSPEILLERRSGCSTLAENDSILGLTRHLSAVDYG